MTQITDIEKKDVIRQAARELFIRFGYSKTSMDDIAAESNLAKPTLYYYYENKEAIFNEIVVEEARQFMDRVERKLPKNLPADEKLVFFFRTIYEDLKIYAAELKEVPQIICDHSPRGRPIVKKIGELFTEKLQPLLEAGKTEGLFSYDETDVTVQTLQLMTHFMNLEWMRQHPEEQRDKIIDIMLNILINGLRRRTDAHST